MKSSIYYKGISIISFMLVYTCLISQNAAVEQANQLIASKRYASAYELLQGSDPNDQSPEIAIARTNLLLNFYIKTDKYRSFGLKDIAPNQNIQDFRDTKIQLKMLEYKPDSILNKLIKQYPDNYKLHYALGNYYYEVYLVHQDDSWLIPDSVVIENIKTNYLEAYNHGEYDYWSLFGIGYAYLLNDDYDNSIPFLEKSIELNSEYPLSYYNLAYAFLQKQQPLKTIELGKKAYELQQIPRFKIENAMLIYMAYREIGNNEQAMEYLQKAYKLAPNDYYVLVALLEMEIIMDKAEYKRHTNELFKLKPDNPIIYQDIMKAYCSNEKDKEFILFLEAKRNEYKSNLSVSANIHLYMAIAQYGIDEWVSAKINFEKARSLFKNLYKNDHNVFKVIDSYTDAIKKKK